jgi:exonuclease SbcC
MVPTCLSLRNFMCYREPVYLNLRGTRVACLSGENGSGKSTLLDAITWALWGKARVNSDRDLIAIGTTDMEVSFGFILGELEYRVLRRRGRGGDGPPSLEIQTLDGERWRSLSGDNVRQTQQVIDRLLRMDYITFINSAFILQGRADEFTTKAPAQRKQILAEILNLGDYDRHEERARLEMREREQSLHEIDATLASIDQRLGDLPQQQALVDTLGRQLVGLTDSLIQLRDQFAAIQSQLQALEFAAAQRDVLRHRIAGLSDEISSIESEQRALAARLDHHRSVVTRRSEIETCYRELVELRQRSDALAGWLGEQQILMERRRCVDQQIHRANHAVEAEIHSLERQIRDRDRSIRDQPQIVTEIASIQAETTGLVSLEADLAQTRREQSERETERGELQAENQRLRGDMEDLKARLDQIAQADAVCPVCRRSLGGDERQRLEATYQQEGTALGDRYRENQGRLRTLKSVATVLADRLTELDQRRQHLESLNRKRSALDERLRAIELAEQERVALVERREELQRSLLAGEPVAEFQQELTEIEKGLKAVARVRDEHEAIRAKVAALAFIEEDRRRLDQSEAALAGEERQQGLLRDSLERRRAELRHAEEQEARLAGDLVQIGSLRRESDDLQAELGRVERQRSELQEQVGAAQQRVDDCLRLQDQREDLLRERKRTAEEKMIYEELMLAFGKRGIQAMIIETVVPELQDEANAILDKMACNSMHVEFRTQRQTKRGEGVIETLDIVISDEVGRRPYELYSGGEAYRVNFAIRVALSKLLARRAGARLQTLVIDEGFGTQDARGLDGLIEAIHAIEQDFQMILVITHIAELKDVFPTRIDVVRTSNGSQVHLN